MKKITIVLILLFIILTFSYGQTVLIRPNGAVGYLYADDNAFLLGIGIQL
jgi:hypothetical protein